LLNLLKCLAHGVPAERPMWEPWLYDFPPLSKDD
jgi:hypothetical protein